jgi:hypothetical protein
VDECTSKQPASGPNRRASQPGRPNKAIFVGGFAFEAGVRFWSSAIAPSPPRWASVACPRRSCLGLPSRVSRAPWSMEWELDTLSGRETI